MKYAEPPMQDPLNRDPLNKMIKDAASSLGSLWDTIFGEKEETISETNFASPTYSIPELSDLSYSERNLITQPMEDVLQNVRSLVMRGYKVESETIYNQVFSLISSSLVSDLSSVMSSCQQLSSRLVNGGETYEEIMKRYMECASDMNSFRNALGAPWFLTIYRTQVRYLTSL